MTVFLPTNSAMNRITQYDTDRYIALRGGVDPLLLQKVMTTNVVTVGTVANLEGVIQRDHAPSRHMTV